MKFVYPETEEGLVDFLHRCKEKVSKVMLFPRCNAVCYKKVAREVENA